MLFPACLDKGVEILLDKLNRCMGCMREIDDNLTCRYCGYKKDTQNHSSHLSPETKLNERYVLGKVLNYDGESVNYIAFDVEIQAVVNVKEYLPDLLCARDKNSDNINVLVGNEPKYKALISDFIELYRQLSRMRTLRNIQKVYDVFEQNNTVYAVTEHNTNISLKQYLSDSMGELETKDALELFKPIFPTISAIHRAGIIHRGISPDTLFVTDKDELKLCGFAITSLRALGTELSPTIYKGYAAPEQYSPNSFHGPFTDVYSIAAVLYKTLTGTMPPEAAGRFVNDNLIAPKMLNNNIPQGISSAIMRAMNLSPQNRTPNMDDFSQHLSKVSIAEKEIVNEDAAVESEEKKKPKHMLVALGITITILLAIAGVFLFFLLSDNPPAPYSFISMEDESSEVSSDVVSSQPEPSKENSFLMPDLVGRVYNNVKNNTEYQKLFTLKEEQEFNEDYPEGIIFEQNVEKNKLTERGETVTVKVSKGAQFPKIPDYRVGSNRMKIDEYVLLLKTEGIKYRLQEESHNALDNDDVIDTSRRPGETIARDAELVVYYVKNVEEPPPDDDFE